MNEKEKEDMYKFICDFWAWMKTHYRADLKDDAFWHETVLSVNDMVKKYKDYPAVKQIMLGYLNYLEYEGAGRERPR